MSANSVQTVGAYLLFVVGSAVLLYFAYSRFREEQVRQRRIESLCSRRGWSFKAEDSALVARWDGAPFGTGANRRARNVVVGELDGSRFVAFDYSYTPYYETDGEIPSRTTREYVVTAVSMPVALPRLQVEPETAVSRVAGAVFSDINVESDAFNQRFRVTSHAAKFASDVLNPRQVEALLAGPATPWRVAGAEIVTWSPGKQDSGTLGAAVPFLAGVLGRIPAFVWKDRGYDPGET